MSNKEHKSFGFKDLLYMLLIFLFVVINGYLLVQKKVGLKTETTLSDSTLQYKDKVEYLEHSIDTLRASLQFAKKDSVRIQHDTLKVEIPSTGPVKGENEFQYKAEMLRIKEEKEKINLKKQELEQENLALRSLAFKANSKTEKLSREVIELKKKMISGTALQLESVAISALGQKKGVEASTEKAGDARKISICISIAKNLAVLPETHVLYARIINPKGELYSKDAEYFLRNGIKTNFSLKQRIFYETQPLSTCMSWSQPNSFLPGKYLIEIYIDENKSGEYKLKLK